MVRKSLTLKSRLNGNTVQYFDDGSKSSSAIVDFLDQSKCCSAGHAYEEMVLLILAHGTLVVWEETVLISEQIHCYKFPGSLEQLLLVPGG